MNSERKRMLACTGLAAVAVLALVLLSEQGWGIPCPIYHVTGLYCPGCGSMRALHELFHLNVSAAWGYNPAFVVLLPLLAVLFMANLVSAWRGRTLPRRRWHMAAAVVLATGLIVFGVVRNLPGFAFLAPGA